GAGQGRPVRSLSPVRVPGSLRTRRRAPGRARTRLLLLVQSRATRADARRADAQEAAARLRPPVSGPDPRATRRATWLRRAAGYSYAGARGRAADVSGPDPRPDERAEA